MKNYQYFGVIKYTAAGFILGFIPIIIGVLLNYLNGFHGPFYHIFKYSPDFAIIAFSPILLSLVFCFMGMKKKQLCQPWNKASLQTD